MRFDEAIKKVIGMEGKGILADSRKLGAYLSDLAPEDMKMINIICHMSSDHLFDRLAECSPDQNGHQIDIAVSQMREYYSESAADTVERALRRALLSEQQQESTKPAKKPKAEKVMPEKKAPETIPDAAPAVLTNLDPQHPFSKEEFNEMVKQSVLDLRSDPSLRLVISYRSPHPSGNINSIEISPDNKSREYQYYHVVIDHIRGDHRSRLEKSMIYDELISFLYIVMVKQGNAGYYLKDQEETSGTKRQAALPAGVVLRNIRTPRGTSVFMLDLTVNKYDLIYLAIIFICLSLWAVYLSDHYRFGAQFIRIMLTNVFIPILTFFKFKVIDNNYPPGNHSFWWHVVSVVVYALTAYSTINFISYLAAFSVVNQVLGSGLLEMIAVLLFFTFVFWIQMKRREEDIYMLLLLCVVSGMMLVFLIIGDLFALIL